MTAISGKAGAGWVCKRANAEVALELPLARFTLGAVGASNDANRELVTGMATAARDTLNGIIDQVSRLNPGEGARLVSNTTALPQRYGHTGVDLWISYDQNRDGVIASTEWTKVKTADEAVDIGVLWAIPLTEIIGGDLFLKRALYNQVRANASTSDTRYPASSVAALMGAEHS